MNLIPKSLLALALLVAAVSFSMAQEKRRETIMQTREKNLEVMCKLFHAVETHDEQGVSELYQPDVEFCWPPSLPYGGCHHGRRTAGPTWGETWALLQPTAAERKMDPRIVAANDDEVVVLWRQRGLSSAGERFDAEVLGLYRFRDAKLDRAQMFYFDSAAVKEFLAKAFPPELQQKQRELFDRIEKLPEGRQEPLRQAYWKLQAMPEEGWRHELSLANFTSAFSDDERNLLRKLLSLNTPKRQ